MSAVDLGTDWYNYVDYMGNVKDLQISDDGEDWFTNWIQTSQVRRVQNVWSAIYYPESILFCDKWYYKGLPKP